MTFELAVECQVCNFVDPCMEAGDEVLYGHVSCPCAVEERGQVNLELVHLVDTIELVEMCQNSVCTVITGDDGDAKSLGGGFCLSR